MQKRRGHRLPPEAYLGRRTIIITACTHERRSLLNDTQVVNRLVTEIETCAKTYECLVPVYCFMPDHLHLMVQGLEESSKPKELMDEFKSTSGLWFAQNGRGLLWQRNYYDHIVRQHHDWRKQAFYILNNPVRRGLIDDPYQYPYTGSVGYELDELFFDLAL